MACKRHLLEGCGFVNQFLHQWHFLKGKRADSGLVFPNQKGVLMKCIAGFCDTETRGLKQLLHLKCTGIFFLKSSLK